MDRLNVKSYKKLKSFINVISITIITFFLAFIFRPQSAFPNFDTARNTSNTIHTNSQEISHEFNSELLKDKLYSPNVILTCLNDDKILFEKGSKDKIYPASMTKIMTVILAIEKISDPNESILMPSNIFTELYREHAALAGFLAGEKVNVIDLLYGSLLSSGAECSKCLALYVSNSEEEFIELMNEKAKALGMKDTNFTNVWGLHNINHYSTVTDISILLKYALKNETFSKIFTSTKHIVSPTNLHPDGLTLYSTMFSRMDSNIFPGGRLLGGKTGYTDEAGLCLASLGEKYNSEYILVTAGAPGNNITRPYHIMDAFAVYNNF